MYADFRWHTNMFWKNTSDSQFLNITLIGEIRKKAKPLHWRLKVSSNTQERSCGRPIDCHGLVVAKYSPPSLDCGSCFSRGGVSTYDTSMGFGCARVTGLAFPYSVILGEDSTPRVATAALAWVPDWEIRSWPPDLGSCWSEGMRDARSRSELNLRSIPRASNPLLLNVRIMMCVKSVTFREVCDSTLLSVTDYPDDF